MSLVSVSQAIDDIRQGKFVILVDSVDRENEGDLAIAADKITPEAINFMATYGRGLVCVPMLPERLQRLQLPLMIGENTSPFRTGFTVSVDAKHGVTTGISARDRALTVEALLSDHTVPEDLVRPGHIFPLRYCEGGVLVRPGQTEGSVDLCSLAGLNPAAVICEVMNDDGTMSRMPDLESFSARHGINIVTIDQIISYRLQKEQLVEQVAGARLPTRWGEFVVEAYTSSVDSGLHIALIKGDVDTDEPVMVRVHSECLTGDVFGSVRCDCGEQVSLTMEALASEDRGVLLYMRQEGRGIGLGNKVRAYALQDSGMDTVEANATLGFPADLRHYGIAAQILASLGLRKVRLMTNNPQKISGLEGYGFEIIDRIPLEVRENPENRRYLQTKHTKLGHLLNIGDALE